jgi:hypothetical protein
MLSVIRYWLSVKTLAHGHLLLAACCWLGIRYLMPEASDQKPEADKD